MAKWEVLVKDCDDPDLKEIRVGSDEQGGYCELIIDKEGRYGNIYLTEEEVVMMYSALGQQKQHINQRPQADIDEAKINED